VCTSTSKLRFDSWARCSATFFSVENKKKIIVFKFYFLTRQSISSSLSLRPVCCISSKDNGIITKSNFPIGKKRRTKSWKGRRRRAADKRQWILDLCNRLVGCWGNDEQEEKRKKFLLFFFREMFVCVCDSAGCSLFIIPLLPPVLFYSARWWPPPPVCVPDLYKNLHAIFAVSCDVLIVLLHSQ
jgi:hypothetical protein